MPIGFVNYAAALCEKAYPLWGGSREDYENMIMGTRLCPLPQFYEMEPFVRKCHVHFALKQCTLEANPHLVGINLHRLMTGKWRRPRLYFGGKWLSGGVWRKEKRKQQYESTRFQKQMRCCPHRGCLPHPLKSESEISFTATMVHVNGPRVTTYCDPPKQNKNLISLKWKLLFWKHHSHYNVRSVPASH